MALIPLTDQGDVKLYILCIMQKVGYPLDYSSVNDIALYDGVISNMDFIEAFDSRESDGLVARDENGQYYVTEDGKFIEQTLKSDLVGYIHDRGLRAAVQFVSFTDDKVKKVVKTTELDGGRVLLELSLIKENEELMKIALTLDTQYQAKKMAMAFSEDPGRIYMRLIMMLGGQ